MHNLYSSLSSSLYPFCLSFGASSLFPLRSALSLLPIVQMETRVLPLLCWLQERGASSKHKATQRPSLKEQQQQQCSGHLEKGEAPLVLLCDADATGNREKRRLPEQCAVVVPSTCDADTVHALQIAGITLQAVTCVKRTINIANCAVHGLLIISILALILIIPDNPGIHHSSQNTADDADDRNAKR